ncbi:MAG: PAS domain-containing sensor histidine kinase [Thermodesulfobacteriota bacterium]|nr:PAS domain-containing sensor histidine kinase [Thermodesulfobacteriota bacterium]
MEDKYKTKGQLVAELAELRQRIVELEAAETERKQAEEEVRKAAHKFQTILNSVNDGVAVMDRSLTVKEVNTYRFEALGLSREQVIGKKCYEAFQHRNKPCEVCPVQPAFEKTEMVRMEKSAVLKDGTVKYFDTQSTPIFDDKGIVVQVVSSIRDITERKRAEEELEVHREHLRLINQILRHDILNDLTAVKSALRLYESSNDEEFLKKASRYVDRGAGTIKRMRELESIISSHKDLEFYDIKDVIRKVIENYEFIEFTIEGKCLVLANGAIDSVIDNIISNAVVHGKTDRIDITIDKQEDLCEVRIADYGIGIPDEMKDKIFEEDFKYGETGRTGLGLHIVKKAMENYGGSVYVEDNTPQGAVFVLRLKRLR